MVDTDLKIVLVNLKFSSDLGDSVIAECLEHGLKRRLPDLVVANCDLGGRKNFGSDFGLLGVAAQKALTATPAFLKQSVYAKLLETAIRRQLLPYYDEAVNGADLALFGSGEILADDDLNMPMKVAAAASIVRNRNLPIAIHAVGVGEKWSDKGAQLFREAFVGGDIIWTSVCDSVSESRWRRQFHRTDINAPRISLDPGLLSATVYSMPDDAMAAGRNRPLIGLCITHPVSLSAQADAGATPSFEPDMAFYQECVRALIAKNCDVLLFTCGAPTDEAYLRRCFPDSFVNAFEEDQVRLAAPCVAPGALVTTLRKCNGVVSHRLQTSVIAYACKIPHVGLTASRNIDAFFEFVGRREYLLGSHNLTPDIVAATAVKACENRISELSHTLIMDRVERDFDALAAELTKLGPRGAGQYSPA